jgi:hypothetical protein
LNGFEAFQAVDAADLFGIWINLRIAISMKKGLIVSLLVLIPGIWAVVHAQGVAAPSRENQEGPAGVSQSGSPAQKQHQGKSIVTLRREMEAQTAKPVNVQTSPADARTLQEQPGAVDNRTRNEAIQLQPAGTVPADKETDSRQQR